MFRKPSKSYRNVNLGYRKNDYVGVHMSDQQKETYKLEQTILNYVDPLGDIWLATWRWLLFTTLVTCFWFFTSFFGVASILTYIETNLNVSSFLSSIGTTLSYLIVTFQVSSMQANENGVKTFFNLCGSCSGIALFLRGMLATDSSETTWKDSLKPDVNECVEDICAILESIPYVVKYTFRQQEAVDIKKLPVFYRERLFELLKTEINSKITIHSNDEKKECYISPFNGLITLLIDHIGALQKKGVIHGESQFYKYVDAIMTYQGGINAISTYSPPRAFQIILNILFGIYFTLFSIGILIPNNSYNSIWLSILITFGFFALYGVSLKYRNPFKIKRTSHGQRAHITIGAEESQITIKSILHCGGPVKNVNAI